MFSPYPLQQVLKESLKISLVTVAAMLAICLLALVHVTSTAEATSLPHNGKIAFVRHQGDNYDIYTVDPDGSDKTAITNSPDNVEVGVDFSPDGSRMCVHLNGGAH
jgi:hypothetical protein